MVEQKDDLENRLSNIDKKSNFKPLIPVEDSIIVGKKADHEDDHKMEKQSTKGKKTRKDKARKQLQKKLKRNSVPSKPVFQTSVLPAIGKTGSVATPILHGPDLIKQCKVYPIDCEQKEKKMSDSKYFEVSNEPNTQMTSVDLVPDPDENAVSVIASTSSQMRRQTPKSKGLISSRCNKVHPKKAQKVPDIEITFTDDSLAFYEEHMRNRADLMENPDRTISE